MYPDKMWDYNALSINPHLTMEMIEMNIDKDWDWSLVSSNPNLTIEMIEKHPDKSWDWNRIAQNDMNISKEKFRLKKYREHMAAFKIQQLYMRAKYTPTYAYCRKLHMKFYDENFRDII